MYSLLLYFSVYLMFGHRYFIFRGSLAELLMLLVPEDQTAFEYCVHHRDTSITSIDVGKAEYGT